MEGRKEGRKKGGRKEERKELSSLPLSTLLIRGRIRRPPPYLSVISYHPEITQPTWLSPNSQLLINHVNPPGESYDKVNMCSLLDLDGLIRHHGSNCINPDLFSVTTYPLFSLLFVLKSDTITDNF